jgi:DNA-binding XRE family transcriptional regulator
LSTCESVAIELSPYFALNLNLPPLYQILSLVILLSMEQGNRPIPNRLQLHRKILRYKQSQVAQLIGLKNTVMLSAWERGETMPSAINLMKLSIVYRTFPHELYSELFLEFKEAMKVKKLEVFKSE